MMRNIIEEDKKYILNIYKRNNLNIVRGKGSHLYDGYDNKYLDMYSGISVNNLGLSNPEILYRISEQASKYIHLSNYFVSEPTVNLAKLLVESSFASKVFFTNSGTEANEAAIKLARKFGKSHNDDKVEIVTAYNSFHGRTNGGLSLTGQEKYQRDFRPLLPKVKHFKFNDSDDFIKKVNKNTCAVFLEIIQGEGGIIEISNEFSKTLSKLSREYNFLIVIDEIQTGLGRVGDLFGYEKLNIKPDIITLAKSLGGGIPLGAMLVSKKIEAVLKPGDHGSTFGGNPLACAVGEYVLETVTKKDFLNEVKIKSKYLFKELEKLKGKYPEIIKDIRGRGLMIGIDVGNYALSIKDKSLDKNMLLNVTNNSIIRLLPSLTINNNEIEEFLTKFNEVLKDEKN